MSQVPVHLQQVVFNIPILLCAYAHILSLCRSLPIYGEVKGQPYCVCGFVVVLV